MISYLQGQIKRIGEKSLTVLVGGVGYEVFVTNDILTNIHTGAEIELFIHTAVREDAMDLFGFQDESKYYFFKQIGRA